MLRSTSPNRQGNAHALAEGLRGFVGKIRRRLRDQADAGDFTPSQIAVLHRLEREGPATTSALARAEGMRPQSMGTIIATLDNAGLISGMPDPTDGRQTILSLTDRCREWLRAGRAARQDWLVRAIDASLSPSEQQHLVDAMPLLRRLIGE